MEDMIAALPSEEEFALLSVDAAVQHITDIIPASADTVMNIRRSLSQHCTWTEVAQKVAEDYLEANPATREEHRMVEDI